MRFKAWLKRFFSWVPFGKVPEIKAEKLSRMLNDGSRPQILDVRTELEWRTSHIPGAISTPVTHFSAALAELQLDKNRPIIAICLSAHRSIPAVRTLRELGYRDACQLQGGMLSWWHHKLPVEHAGDEAPPT
jgi:rhodanese-related sulfurtransferase